MSRLGLDWCRNLKPGEEKNRNFVKLSRLLWPAFCESKPGINFHNLRTKRRVRGPYKTQQLPAGEGTVCLAVPRSVPFGWGYFWRKGAKSLLQGIPQTRKCGWERLHPAPHMGQHCPCASMSDLGKAREEKSSWAPAPCSFLMLWAKMCLAQSAGL